MGRVSIAAPAVTVSRKPEPIKPKPQPPQVAHVEEKKTLPPPSPYEAPVAVHNMGNDQSQLPPVIIPPVINFESVAIPSFMGQMPIVDRIPDNISLPPQITIQWPSNIPSVILLPIPSLPEEVQLPEVPSPSQIILPTIILKPPSLPDSARPKFHPLPQPTCFGNKLKPGDMVDSTAMPFASKPWNPDSSNKVVRWFDTRWKCDGEYELLNYCVFSTHMELELKQCAVQPH